MTASCDAHVLPQFGDYVGLTSSEGTLESVSKSRQTNRQHTKKITYFINRTDFLNSLKVAIFKYTMHYQFITFLLVLTWSVLLGARLEEQHSRVMRFL